MITKKQISLLQEMGVKDSVIQRLLPLVGSCFSIYFNREVDWEEKIAEPFNGQQLEFDEYMWHVCEHAHVFQGLVIAETMTKKTARKGPLDWKWVIKFKNPIIVLDSYTLLGHW